MFNIQLKRPNDRTSLLGRLGVIVLFQKLNNPFGYVLLTLLSIPLAYVVVLRGTTMGIVIIAGLIGGTLAFASLFNLKLGIILMTVMAFFLLGVKRLSDGIPLGLGMDIMVGILFFGLFIKQVEKRDWSFAKNPITKIVLIWIFYTLLQVGNPSASSRLAWVYTVRSMAGFMLMYFIILYSIDNLKTVTLLIRIWIFLAALAGAYGFYQEYVGFQPFEMAWINQDVARFNLLYIMGKFRKFSYFSDPMVYGFVEAYTAVLCFTLLSGPFGFWKKAILTFLGVGMMWAMLFSGTRAAYVLLPAGFFFYAVITFQRNIIIVTSIMFLIGTAVVIIPSSNANIIRFQSAFKPGEDESYKARIKNQAFIKPYIQTHPMGGGLGSVGAWGQKFSPGSMLSKFPPDSGYMRIAVEMGSIGLFIYCTLLWTVFRVGVKNHFRIKDPKIKSISISLLTVLFTLAIANFPQEAIGQIPTSLVFFLIVALVNRLKALDDQLTAEKNLSLTTVNSA